MCEKAAGPIPAAFLHIAEARAAMNMRHGHKKRTPEGVPVIVYMIMNKE